MQIIIFFFICLWNVQHKLLFFSILYVWKERWRDEKSKIVLGQISFVYYNFLFFHRSFQIRIILFKRTPLFPLPPLLQWVRKKGKGFTENWLQHFNRFLLVFYVETTHFGNLIIVKNRSLGFSELVEREWF